MNYTDFHKIGKAFVDLYGNDGEHCYKEGVCLWCGDNPVRKPLHDTVDLWKGRLHTDECWVGQFEKIVVEALDKPPWV
jgi:hypothetical protein